VANTSDKKSKAYKNALRDVQRYRNFIEGRTDRQTRDPDKARVTMLRKAATAESRRRARERVMRESMRVRPFRGKIHTSPRRKNGHHVSPPPCQRSPVTCHNSAPFPVMAVDTPARAARR
jgi:hypothetical protein